MKPIRILVADDHAEFRKILGEYLRRQPNIEIVGEAVNGKDAVEQVGRFSPDLVLMDISMPLQSGLEATRVIKERWPATRVVIATMHDQNVYRFQAQKVKADDYVLKTDLKAMLDSVFGRTTARRFSRPPVHPEST